MAKGGAKGCCAGFSRFLLVAFNIVFWLSGIAILAVGIWMLQSDAIVSYVDVVSALEDSGDFLEYAAYVMIGAGTFVLVVGFFGCCGAIKENQCMLGAYIFCLVIVLGVEVTAGVFGLIFADTLDDTLAETFQEALEDHYGGDKGFDKAFTQGVDFVQVEGRCCGYQGQNDYHAVNFNIPYSCCLMDDCDVNTNKLDEDDVVDWDGCQEEFNSFVTPDNDTFSRAKGCKARLDEWLDDNSTVIFGIGIGIAALEVLGLLCAILLCCDIRKNQ